MTRGYGQYCGLARALELVGSRWTLLIVRELLAGPKRYTELAQGLPGIPSNILSSRLREMEDGGIVERALEPRPSTSVVYTLTAYGQELEGPMTALGLWGVKSLPPPTTTTPTARPPSPSPSRACSTPNRQGTATSSPTSNSATNTCTSSSATGRSAFLASRPPTPTSR